MGEGQVFILLYRWISKAKTPEESHFYLILCAKENYSARELSRQIDSGYYERYMLSKEKVLPEPIKGLKENPFLDSYVIEFLDLPSNFKEMDLRKGLIKNMKDFSLDGILYRKGIPDFSVCAKVTVSIENMNEIRRENFRKCDVKCAEKWSREKYEGKSRWTPSDVKQWRKENGYTWHERNDMVICDLVPTKINRFFGHLGGVSECKKCRLV